MNRRRMAIFFISFFILQILRGQTNQKYFNNPIKVMPPPPDAAALGKFGQIPVGHYTGVPDISIPIYNLELNDFVLPISLKYHSAGIRVNEIASSVGLGWSLQAGGVISCTINNTFDFDVNGNQNGDAPVIYNAVKNGDFMPFVNFSQLSNEIDPYYILLRDMSEGGADGDPDMFQVNAADQSISFMFDENNQPRTIPFSPHAISRDALANVFTVTDEKGVKFLFSIVEVSTIEPTPESSCGDLYNSFHYANPYTPTWYLSNITTPNGNQVNFEYESYNYSYTTQGSETWFLAADLVVTGSNCAFLPPPSKCDFNTQIQGKRLKKITSTAGHIIDFTYNAQPRQDLTGGNAIQKISIKYKSVLIDEYTFVHGYFGPVNTGMAPENYRLKLTGILQQQEERYSFEYNSLSMPARTSYSQDYWGYYNGKINNTLVPKTRKYGFLGDGADRRLDENYMQVGILTKIIYPTGGSTEFYYEPNDFRFEGSERTFITQQDNLSLSTISNLTTSFTTGNTGGPIEANIQFQTNVTGTLPAGDYLIGELIGNTTPSTIYFETLSAGKAVRLQPNTTYQLKLRSSTDVFTNGSGQNVPINASIVIQRIEYATTAVDKNVKTGGVRIAKTIDKSVTGIPVVRKYLYTDFNNSNPVNNSSGFRMHDPVNAYPQEVVWYDESVSPIPRITCYQFLVSSTSFNNMTPIQGSPVAYEFVSILEGENGENGKTEFTFKRFSDNPSYTTPIISDFQLGNLTNLQENVKPTSFDWLRGLELKQTQYKRSGSAFVAVKTTENTFVVGDPIECYLPCENSSPNQKSILALRPVVVDPEHQVGGTIPELVLARFNLRPHYYVSDWYRVSSTKQRVYDQNDITKYVENVINYTYSNPAHAQPTLIENKNSKQGFYRQKMIYSFDYNVTSSTYSSSQGIKWLKENNIIVPIEELDIKAISGTEYVTSGRIQTRKANQAVLDKIYVLNIQSPVPVSQFTTSHIDGSGNFVKDVRYKEETKFTSYDAGNNLLEVSNKTSPTESYIWDYDKVYPVARIANSGQNAVAYTSFETEAGGNWSLGSILRENDAITGKQCYQLSNGNITRSNLNSTTEYIVTYWTKNGTAFSLAGTQGTAIQGRSVGNWKCFMHRITGVTQITFTGTGSIDELRLFPKDGGMVTRTYDPLIGVTAQCDANNQITYYEYDSFNRLKLIRDQDKNILKKFDYQFRETVQ